jgi:hypothetical protein
MDETVWSVKGYGAVVKINPGSYIFLYEEHSKVKEMNGSNDFIDG